jgi:magnesium chelatase family protein
MSPAFSTSSPHALHGKVEPHAGVVFQISSSSSALPGVGTSMLARRLTTILPAMTLAEAIETTRIHSVAGLTGDRTAWVTTRPCRHPTTPARMRGGSAGATCRCQGRISLAHHSNLFLDELSEPTSRLRGVAQPLEEGVI